MYTAKNTIPSVFHRILEKKWLVLEIPGVKFCLFDPHFAPQVKKSPHFSPPFEISDLRFPHPKALNR